jgi:hypothetical protein
MIVLESTPNTPAHMVSIEFIRLPCQFFYDVARDLLWKEKEPVSPLRNQVCSRAKTLETMKIALSPVGGFHPRFLPLPPDLLLRRLLPHACQIFAAKSFPARAKSQPRKPSPACFSPLCAAAELHRLLLPNGAGHPQACGSSRSSLPAPRFASTDPRLILAQCTTPDPNTQFIPNPSVG